MNLFLIFFSLFLICSKSRVYEYQYEKNIEKESILEKLNVFRKYSFKVPFTLTVKKYLKTYSFDGTIFSYPEKKSLKIILKDILLKKIILEIKKYYSLYQIYLYEKGSYFIPNDDFIITINELDIPSTYFIPFIQQKKIFLKKIKEVKKYLSKDQNQIKYIIKNDKVKQIIEISLKTGYIKNIQLETDKKKVLKIEYSKYIMKKNLPFPRKAQLYYYPKKYYVEFYFYSIFLNVEKEDLLKDILISEKVFNEYKK